MTTSDLKEQDSLKGQAIALRQQGLTYPQISEHLNGALSVDWCKRNLKQVKLPVVEDKCLDEVIRLAIRPEGVSVYEANGVIIKHNQGSQLSKEKMRQIRDKAKTKNPDCLFRPAWVSTEKPEDSYRAFCAYIIHLQDELDNITRWYCDSFPDAKPSAVKYEMLEYLKPSKDSISLSRRISRAEQLCENMEERLHSQ